MIQLLERELDALIELAGRALKSRTEQLWLERFVQQMNALQQARQVQRDSLKKDESEDSALS